MIKQRLKRVTLRVMLLLAAIMAVTQAASASFPSTLYFDFSNISSLDSYPYKTVHFYDGGNNSQEITLQAVTGSSTCYYIDNAETGAGTCEIFLGTSSSDKKKMYGISAPTDGSNMIVVTSWNSTDFDGNGNYSWSTYSSSGSAAVYLRRDFPGVGNNWNDQTGDEMSAIEGTTNGFHYLYACTQSGTAYVNVYDKGDNKNFVLAPEQDTEVTVTVAQESAATEISKGNDKAVKFTVTAGLTYDIKYYRYNDNDEKGSLVISASSSGSSSSISSVKIIGSIETSDWDATGKSMTSAGNGIFTYTVSNVSGQKWFAFYADESEYLVPTSDSDNSSRDLGNGALAYSIKDDQSGDWSFYYTFESSKTYTVTVNTTAGTVSVAETELMPVLPDRVKTWSDAAGWAKVTEDHPAIYLLGDVLNYGRVTPEYELIPNADYTEYTIEHFAMRKCDVKAVAYYGQNSAPVTIAELTAVDPFTGSNFEGATMTPGVDYRAVCRKDNDGKWTLTLEANSQDDTNAKNLPPFLSMVGYNFRQASSESTPNDDRNTDNGWEESWIQQDAEGNILRDRDGKVMYNTMWPPKNQIFFKAEGTTSTGEAVELEINSDNLTFVPYRKDGKVVIMTGLEWKEYLKGGNKDSDYYYLFNTESSDGDAVNSEGIKDENGTVLSKRDYWVESMKNNYYYARYVVPNVWILGASKIWTGWTGGLNSDKGADWNHHSQWGYKYTTENNTGSEIQANTPYYMQKSAGNFMFEKPTYFKSVEFFYCLGENSGNNDNTSAIHTNSLLYTVRSKGEPSIQARADDNNEDGNFKMELGAELSQGVTVTGIEIRRYSATLSTNEKWQAVDKYNSNCQETDEAARVYTWPDVTGLSLTKDEFNTEFQNWDPVGRKDPGLAEGRYFYGMTLTFSDGTDTFTETNVKSNPFTIVKADVETNPEVYQLCRYEDSSEHGGYDYVTYAPAATKAYLVKVTGDAIEYEETSVPTVDEYLDGKIMKWTDRMFVREDVPAKFLSNTTYDITSITGYTLKTGKTETEDDTLAEVTPEAGGMDADTKGYAAIYDWSSDFESDIKVELILNYTVENSNYHSNPVVKTFTYTFPVATFGEPVYKVETVEDGDNYFNKVTVTAPYAEPGGQGTTLFTLGSQTYEHALNVNVPVYYPNIGADAGITPNVTLSVGAETDSKTIDGSITNLWFKNQDPNEWINTADGSYNPISRTVTLNTAPYTNCNTFPAEETYTSKTLSLADNTIAAPSMSNMQLVKAVMSCNEQGELDPTANVNLYRAVLAIATMDIDYTDQCVVNGTALLHATSSTDTEHYYALKAGKEESLALLSEKTDGFHHCSIFGDSEKLTIIAMTDPFHWYAEMDDELDKLDDYYVALARAFFFKAYGSGMELVAEAGNAEGAAVLYAQAETDATQTHYTFLSKFGTAAVQGDIITSVNEIAAGQAVKAGKGWIEVNGRGVAVYSADGMCVANGPGRFNVASGVYVVRADGKNYKVVVK